MELVTGMRERLLDSGMLCAAWLRAPGRTGAIVPSGSRLAALMAREIPPGPGLVVELGGGTGSITAGLLYAGVEHDQLVIVERDGQMARHLAARFPRCRVLCGDACRLPELLSRQGITEPVKAVVSSLPLLSMSRVKRAQLIAGVRKLICGSGSMVQYTYGRRCPVPARMLERRKLRAQRVGRVWRNLPPASVWRFESSA